MAIRIEKQECFTRAAQALLWNSSLASESRSELSHSSPGWDRKDYGFDASEVIKLDPFEPQTQVMVIVRHCASIMAIIECPG